MTLPANFWTKAKRTNCIVWQGAQNSKGYGCFGVNGRSQLAHRLAWEDANGPIPDGMEIDHLCRNRACITVEHLELVTSRENTRRARCLSVGDWCSRGHFGDWCSRGHFIGAERDLYLRKRNGGTECRECRSECRECRSEAKRRHKARTQSPQAEPGPRPLRPAEPTPTEARCGEARVSVGHSSLPSAAGG